jgi:hypothetical protein
MTKTFHIPPTCFSTALGITVKAAKDCPLGSTSSAFPEALSTSEEKRN